VIVIFRILIPVISATSMVVIGVILIGGLALVCKSTGLENQQMIFKL